MKKILTILMTLVVSTAMACFAKPKEVKVTCSQEDAKIYVDNEYVGHSPQIVMISPKEGHVRVRVEKEGYVTRKFKIKADEKRKVIDIELEKDEAWIASNQNELANKFFTIPVSKKYIEKAGSKEDAAKLAWKQLHQILLNYFDEIEESNMLGGFIQSAWVSKQFYQSSLDGYEGITWRTRVSIKETSDGDNLAYRIKISSEIAPANYSSDDSFVQTSRVLRKYEPMIQEFQARLSDF